MMTMNHNATLSTEQAEALLDNLRQQQALYQRVNETLLAKKVSILQQAITEFGDQDKELRQLRKAIDALEKQRLDLLKLFWPRALEQVQARMVYLAMPDAKKEAFNHVRADLKKTLNEVASLQKECQRLLELSLEWANQSMNWLKESAQNGKGTTYTAEGRTKQRAVSTVQRKI